MRVWVLCFLLLSGCATFEIGIEPVGSVPGTEPVLLRQRVTVSAYDPENGVRLLAFAPGDMNASVLATLPETYGVVSPNGVWIAYPDDPSAVSYGRIGAQMTTFSRVTESRSAGERVTGLSFNNESTWLAFTHTWEGNWMLTLVELATGKTVSVGGLLILPPEPLPANGHHGALRVMGWLDNNAGLVVEAFDPNGQGFLGGPLLIDLEGVTLDAWTELPAARPIFTDPDVLAKARIYGDPLSPDGSFLLYLYNDPMRPIDDYPPRVQGVGQELPPNTAAMVNTRTGEHTLLAQAEMGEGIAEVSWSSDGRHVVILTGSHENTFFIPSPRVVMVSPDAPGRLIPVTTLTSDDGTRKVIGSLQMCDEGIFFSVSPSSDQTLTRLASVTGDVAPVTLLEAPIINIVTCIP